MKILVFDDNKTHRAAATAQLGSTHDLTVVGTYDEAQKLLTPTLDTEQVNQKLEEQFPNFNPWNSEDEAMKTKYLAAQKEVTEELTVYPGFEAVLTDLLVPTSNQQQGGRGGEGEEESVGIFIGLLAAVKAKAKYVAVFTDSSHHDSPASACFDVFNDHECTPTSFAVEGSKVTLINNRNWVTNFGPEDLGTKLEYAESSKRSDTIRAKNWLAVLDYITK